jgi:hypothetical protein
VAVEEGFAAEESREDGTRYEPLLLGADAIDDTAAGLMDETDDAGDATEDAALEAADDTEESAITVMKGDVVAEPDPGGIAEDARDDSKLEDAKGAEEDAPTTTVVVIVVVGSDVEGAVAALEADGEAGPLDTCDSMGDVTTPNVADETIPDVAVDTTPGVNEGTTPGVDEGITPGIYGSIEAVYGTAEDTIGIEITLELADRGTGTPGVFDGDDGELPEVEMGDG